MLLKYNFFNYLYKIIKYNQFDVENKHVEFIENKTSSIKQIPKYEVVVKV